ncbi:hypothetical protein COU76_03090 [Candidatus Peregrinibacteria bacterium CG10_big_fil_rev_8_21_14_0_10_49_10]|nr:MAG: hypothetical protein COU76_03090 [Candidatus Peregrinibacteria bacterium CG10_big_fil_rev_8_21_14_0_10_49_10]
MDSLTETVASEGEMEIPSRPSGTVLETEAVIVFTVTNTAASVSAEPHTANPLALRIFFINRVGK